MSETGTVEKKVSPAQLVADLTNLATGIFDDRGVELTTLEDGTQSRKLTTPNNGGCVLTETVTAEGERRFSYQRTVLVVQWAEYGVRTTEWQEGGSSVDVTLVTEEHGTRRRTSSEPTEISYYTHLYLSQQFPLPKPEEAPKRESIARRLGRLLGLTRTEEGQHSL